MAADPEQKTDFNPVAGAGLPGASVHVEDSLRQAGIDPDRLSIFKFGRHGAVFRGIATPWVLRMLGGYLLWAVLLLLRDLIELPEVLIAIASLCIGLLILQSACEVLITATERLAARLSWSHYSAGTVAEILSTLPELVVILFLVPVSPVTAFVIALITIYNNALVFSLYSFFLPKNRQGKFLMPEPITEAGTQILIGGGALGLILGLVMLAFVADSQSKQGFTSADLLCIGVLLLVIFTVYLFKLVTSYAKEEAEVRENLDMGEQEIEQRLTLVYENVRPSSFMNVSLFFLLGVLGAIIGGEQVAEFAAIMLQDLQINAILTALILAVFAGMSEYVILWKSHRRREYGIALANAFGGITQVMFLVLPFTLISIAIYQLFFNPLHPDLPIPFTLSHIFLLIFLFPTFYTLSALLEEDHTLGLLDTTIMTGIFLFLILLLVTHGA